MSQLISLIRTTSVDYDFRELVKLLDADLAIRDGKDHSFFAQFNSIDNIRYAVVAFYNEIPAGCGAIKSFDDAAIMEVKRMFVKPKFRKKGIARAVLSELERWTVDLGYRQCILETGMRQPEAIGLYESAGYERIPNYGQYEKVETSVCFRKKL